MAATESCHAQILNSTVFLILIGVCAAEDRRFLDCNRNFICGGSVGSIGYPFWGGDRRQECGVNWLKLQCAQENFTTIKTAGESFRVLSINTGNNSMRIAPNDPSDDICGARLVNASWWIARSSDGGDLILPREVEKLYLFFSCSSRNISGDGGFSFNCTSDGANRVDYVVREFSLSRFSSSDCERNVTVLVMKAAFLDLLKNESIAVADLAKVVNGGFEVVYKMNGTNVCDLCKNSGGLCWSGTISQPNAACLCPGGPQQIACSHKGNVLNLNRKIGIGAGAAAVSAIIVCIIFGIYHHRYKKHCTISSLASHGSSSCPRLTEELEKMGIHLFAYHELQEATDHFDPERELGDGAYGTVYKGNLQDGRIVAVKRLHEYHYKRVEQFMNEVELLSRLRHQNLVSLYGCTSCNVKELLLVYEYIPNGILADHLHGLQAKPGLPSWITRLNIAIEIASALAYLHASGVIHRDVKSTNILLDNNFTVKVADFGISRIRPIDATHISTAPQGTPGYVDPEYNEFYQLTEKSDVYSFGVVLMELISSKPAVDITRDRHEINLATMANTKIQRHALHELVDPHLGFESDYRVRTMITAAAEVGFQCLQIGRDMRPNMQDVLDSLQDILNGDYYSTDAVVDMIPADDVVVINNSSSVPVSPNSVATGRESG